ncbi:MAG: flagellar filament outer layer protein FlaA [Spirochaetaceae bacterium]|jgi:hypothetical protein|nr:flagellar filament outer layer protein FlaA [Spirochaetaceae bacterium]
MKRIFILVVIALLTVGVVVADEAVLIDFSLLTADIHPPRLDKNGNEIPDRDRRTGDIVVAEELPPTQNRATLMDFNNSKANANFTARHEWALKSSLAIGNWDIELTQSARSVETKALSYTLEAPSKAWAFVMGARIHFPVEAYNVSAVIKPPFEIPAYEPQATIGDDGTFERPETVSVDRGGDIGAVDVPNNGITSPSRFEANLLNLGDLEYTFTTTVGGEEVTLNKGYGVVKNVGTIKSIAVNVYGLNYPHSLSVILIDDKGKETAYFMGYLNFEGWGTLVWDNPNYVKDVRNRDLRLYPMYPQSMPFVKFGGFKIQREAGAVGGDFITYFKDVKLIYDKAVLEPEYDRDIEDESLWGIIRDREAARRQNEMQNTGIQQVQRLLDLQRQAPQQAFAVTPGADQGGE